MNDLTLLDAFKTSYQNLTSVQAHDYISLYQVVRFIPNEMFQRSLQRKYLIENLVDVTNNYQIKTKDTARNVLLSKCLQRGFPIKMVQHLAVDHRIILTLKKH